MAKTTITGRALGYYNKNDSMGMVKDTVYIRCFWPDSNRPLFPFAPGSSGIEVEGPPTPRNIVFPEGTIFSNGTRGDCFFSRERKEEMVNGKLQTVIKTVEITTKPERR